MYSSKQGIHPGSEMAGSLLPLDKKVLYRVVRVYNTMLNSAFEDTGS